MIKVLAALAGLALVWLPPSGAGASPPASSDAASRALLSCSGINVTALRFDSFGLSSNRGTFSAPVTVRCDENTAYRVRLSSANDCRLLGPRSSTIRYAIFADAGYRDVVLDCNALPVDIPGHGTMTFHLYGRTAPLVTDAAGAYADSVSVRIYVDGASAAR